MRTQPLHVFEDRAERHAFFKGVMKEAMYAELNLLPCVPFTNLRKTTKAGILLLLSICNGLLVAKLGATAGETPRRSNSAFILPVEGEHSHHALIY